MSEDLRATTTRISGHRGEEIEAYLAQPEGGEARGGVVVIHTHAGLRLAGPSGLLPVHVRAVGRYKCIWRTLRG